MNCGDPTVDGLLRNPATVTPLMPGATGLAVAYLQDLLRGHGHNQLPDPRANGYGIYGPATSQAVSDYRRKFGLPAAERADSAILADLVARPAENALLGPAYVPLVLNKTFTPILRFVWLTSLFETRGVFASLNLNTDRCGLSFGILQWSQKPGQLHIFLNTCRTREPSLWAQIMGDAGILDYTAKSNGGLDSNGLALDPAFELTTDPWKRRMEDLGASTAIQRIQIDLAADAYNAELQRIRRYASGIRSARGFAFLLDLANQFGAGRLARLYPLNAAAGDTESTILIRLEDAFTQLSNTRFQPQVRTRREFFRTTTLLSDQPLDL